MKILTPLTEDELFGLEARLRAIKASDLSTIDGLLTAVATSPEPIHPDEWLKLIFSEQAFKHLEERGEQLKVYEYLIRHLNGIEAILTKVPEKYHPLFRERDLSDTVEVVVDNWCRGYVQGIQLCASQWREQAAQIEAWLKPIMVFAQPANSATRSNLDKSNAKSMKVAIEENARLLHQFWLDKRTSKRKQYPFIREYPKLGRNDLCYCGSGKKFKLCCGAH